MTKPESRCQGRPFGWGKTNHNWVRDWKGVKVETGEREEVQRCSYCYLLRLIRNSKTNFRRYAVLRTWRDYDPPPRY